SLAILAAATPAVNGGGSGSGGSQPASSCSTAPVLCCEQAGAANSDPFATILKGLGVDVQDLNVLAGLTCDPISVVGVGSGASCSANAVCCDQNIAGGLAAIGCVPVDL
ncbi:fungal hydrophobin, partial [Trametes cingulata]